MIKCSVGYCTRPREPKSKYCKKHSGNEAKVYNKNVRRHQRESKFYQTKEWKQLRTAYITAHPYCERCYTKGIYKKAEIIHHKIEVKDDWDKRLDWDNLEAVCRDCHNKEHKRK